MATPRAAAASNSESDEGENLSPPDDSSEQTFQTPFTGEDFVVLDSLNEEEIDFCSPHFNPSVALKTDNVIAPAPDTPSFKSLSSYEDAVNRRKQLRASKEKSEKKDSSTRSQSNSESKRSDRSYTVDKVSKHGLEKHRSSSSKALDSHKSTSESQKDKSRSHTAASSKSRTRDSFSKDEGRHRSSTSSLRRTRDAQENKKTKSKEKYDERKDRRDYSNSSDEDDQKGVPKRQVQRRDLKNVFTRMEMMSGPLSLLTRCVKNREHVRVVTRGAVTLSSICRGYIVAFDKYCNMAMIDVDEIYRRPAALGKVKARISHKLLDAQKTLQQESKDQRVQWQAKGRQLLTTTAASKDSSVLSAASDSNKNILPPASDSLTKDSTSGGRGKSSKSEKDPGQRIRTIESHFTTVKPPPDSKLNPKLLKSVYSSMSVPQSRYEREALLLGIPDENVEHRHLNQLLLRGENVVSISIIQDF